MKYTIDRFENHYAICECETGGFIRIPTEKLPQGAREGSVLLSIKSGVFSLDTNLEIKRRQDMKDRLSSLLKKR